MKIETKYQPELAVSKDITRENLAHVQLEGSRAIATNGHILAVVPVAPEEGDTDGAISAQALKAARKAGRKGGDATLKANGSLEAIDSVTLHPVATFPQPKVDSFPPYQQVIPDVPKDAVTIGLNAEYLRQLAKVLGTGREAVVALTFKPGAPLDPIIVTAKDSEGLAVLMPCRTDSPGHKNEAVDRARERVAWARGDKAA